jgi:hypothetical protein
MLHWRVESALHIGLVSWFLSILSLRGRLNLGNNFLSHIYLNLFNLQSPMKPMTCVNAPQLSGRIAHAIVRVFPAL